MYHYAFQSSVLATTSAFLTAVENEDGSYTSSVGNTGQSILGLLTQGSGWTVNGDAPESPARQYGAPPASSNPNGNRDGSYGSLSVNAHGLLAPHVEILSLIEGFLKLKGELASRVHAIAVDNYDLIRGVYNVLLSKVSSLHSFSLTGIQILRRIIEFAVECIGQWQITVPAISFDGSHQSSGSKPQSSYGPPQNSYGPPSTGNVNFNGPY